MKTIVVKGIGNASVKPDCVELGLYLETIYRDYETAYAVAARKINELNDTLMAIGFEKESVKTTDFKVRTSYESIKDKTGNYVRTFRGYVLGHRLKVTFDFDTKLLAKVLGAIATCVAEPELSVNFTVKNSSCINEMLLKSAAENARRKAEILCLASGVTLGDIVNIDYNWGEINVYSNTRYNMADDCMMACAETSACIEIDPEDIKVNDTVTFVWEIK